MAQAKNTHRILVEVPKEWLPELKAASERRFTSRHSFILRAIRAALDGEQTK